MPSILPPDPNLDHLKKQAKALLRAFRSGEAEAHARFQSVLPRLASTDEDLVRKMKVSLQEAQLVIAREYGFGDWQLLAQKVDPETARPKPHEKMITPREWSTNTVYENQETGDRATTNQVWAMLTACHDGDVEKVTTLLEENPRLVHAEYNYTPPIHFAVREGHLDLCRLLIERGADLGYRSYHFRDTLLQMAEDRQHSDIERLLETRLSARFPVSPRAAEILAATRAGDVDGVIEFLEDDATLVQASNEVGETPLHVACFGGRLDLVQLLVDRGADLNAERADGFRPIHAALNGQGWFPHPDDSEGPAADRYAVAGDLLASGAATNIYVAAATGDRAAVERSLAEDPEYANFRDSHGLRPLSAATMRGDVEMLRLLLGHGADPDLPEHGAPRGSSLWLAVWQGDLEVARLLLEHGADPNGSIESGGSALFPARDNAEMRELLIAHGAEEPMTDFELAIERGDLDAVTRLVDEDPDAALDPNSMFGEGPLSMAANRGHWDLIELLLDRGTTVPDVTKWARSYYFKHYDVAKVLLERGMNPNHKNWHHITLLHDLAHDGDVEKATLLLDHGADIDPIDNEYRSTPLGLAVRAGNSDMVDLLLTRGADPAAGGAEWSTPLAWARRYGRDKVTATLEDAIRESAGG